MSIKLMTKVFESDLPTTEKFVLLAMADYASDSGESIFPSIETLASKTSLSDRSVQRAIKYLIEAGYLEMAMEGGGRNHTNRYRIRCQRFTLSEKGDSVSLKGDNVTIKGDTVSPDPSLTTNESLDVLIGEKNKFLSQMDSLIGCPVGGRSDIEFAEVMLDEWGLDRMRRAASWAQDKAFRSMQTALRAMNTALRNGGFQEQSRSALAREKPITAQAKNNRDMIAAAAARDRAKLEEIDQNDPTLPIF